MDRTVFKQYWAVIGFVVLIWLIPFLFVRYSPFRGFVELGQFGDMFGVVNALFTGLAFAFVVITLLEQQKQLKAQEDQMVRRDFEAVFFEFLKMHNENVQNMRVPCNGEFVSRVNAFGILRNKLEEDHLKKLTLKQLGEIKDSNPKFLIEAYERFYKEQERHLGNYFRTLYQLMIYISRQAGLTEAEKYRYAKIVRARMSNDELTLLFFNGLSEYGKDAVEYIEAFSIFKHLDLEKLRAYNPKRRYNPSAFGREL